MPRRSEKQVVRETPERDTPPVLVLETPRLDDQTWDYIQGRVWDALRLSVLSRARFDKDLEDYNRQYEGTRTGEPKDWPWQGAADLHVPLTAEMVDALHARMAKAALADPLMLVIPNDAASVQAAALLERYYDWWTKTHGVDDVINTAIHLSLRDGVGLLKVGWEQRVRKVKVRKITVLRDETGEPLVDPVSGEPVTQERVDVEDLVEYDSVRVVPVELKDFYLIPAHAYTIDRFGSGAAKGVAHRIWLRWAEIRQRANAGLYRREAVERLRDNAALEREPAPDVTLEGKIALTQPFVVESPEGEPRSDKEFEIFEVFMSWDLDGDGYEEECKFTIAYKWGILLEARVFPYWHQKRPFIAIIPWPRPRRFYGFGIPEALRSLQAEINAIRNQRVDAVTLSLSPPLQVAKGASLRGDVSQPWGPGARFEVEKPGDIAPLQFPPVNPEAYTEEINIRQMAERRIGLFDINTPRGTGARRTQAEIGAIQTEGMVRFDHMIKRVRRSLVDLYEMIHALHIQYMPEAISFSTGLDAQGSPQTEVITRNLMTTANISFRVNGDLPITDREQNRQETYFLFQALMGHPLVQSNVVRQWHLAKVLLEAWDRRDIESLIGTKEEAEALQQAMQQMQQQQQQQMGEPSAGQAPARRAKRTS